MFTAPSGAKTAAAGQVLQSATWDAIGTDYEAAFNQAVTQFGLMAAEVNIAAAATTDLSTANSWRIQITGTATITSLGTGANLWRVVRFQSSGCILTYNASSLILPGQQNILAFAGDVGIFTSDGSGNWRVVDWQSADGSAIIHQDAFRNIMGANGGLEVWQRGAGQGSSFAVNASTTQYTADRWYITTGANQASTVAATTGLTNNSQLAAKVTRNSAQTGTTAYTFGYPLDTDEVQRLRGNKVSLSAQVKAGANWSPTSGTITATLYVGTGTVAKRGGGFATETNVVAVTTNLAVSTGAFITGTSTAVVPTTSTQGEVQFTWTPTGTAGGDDSITIDDVQLEVAVNSSQFERLPQDIMLFACKRHFQKTFPYSVSPAQSGGVVGALSAIAPIANSGVSLYWGFNPQMRNGVVPSITTFNPSNTNANWRNVTAAGDVTNQTDLAAAKSETGVMLAIAASVTVVATIGQVLIIHAQADSGI